MAPGDTARLYHRLTSYEPALPEDPRVLKGFRRNVLADFPARCKSYPSGLPIVALPRAWPAEGAAATAVLAGAHAAAPARLDVARLARLLHLSAGVVRLAERRDGRRYGFRAAGS